MSEVIVAALPKSLALQLLISQEEGPLLQKRSPPGHSVSLVSLWSQVSTRGSRGQTKIVHL